MLLALISLPNCKEEGTLPVTNELTILGQMSLPLEKPLKIAILGGLEFLDPSLMTNCLDEGTDFRLYNSTNHTLPEFSKPLLDEAIAKVLQKTPDLLLIPGDLTYNGEEISHETIAGILKEVSTQGIKVFVVPGNQDINNPIALKYDGTGSEATPTITTDKFAQIYADFGYEDAISRDPNSLSYLAQPFSNLWILGIDAGLYNDIYIDPYTGKIGPALTGQIKSEILEWILNWLAEAKENNITVIGLEHHSVTEDCPNAAKFGPAYVINNHASVEDALTNAGLKIIFTAHDIDITMISRGENKLFDIGSLAILIPPFSFRMVYLENNSIEIETHFIKSIDAPIPGGANLLDYSNAFVEQNLTRRFIGILRKPLYGCDEVTATFYAPYFARGLMAYYAGDEKFPPKEAKIWKEWSNPFYTLYKSVYTDLPPEDRQYTIEMP